MSENQKSDDLKREEDRLRVHEDEKRFHIIMDLIPDGVTIHDKGEIIFANRAFYEMVGLVNVEGVIGKSLFDFAPSEPMSEDMRDAWERHRRAILENKLHPVIESPVHGLNGDIISTEISSAAIIYNGKNAVLNMHRDISERKKMEEALRRANDELERRVEERSEELKLKAETLEEMNIALRVLLKQREQDKEAIEEKVLLNVKELIEPYLASLKTEHPIEYQRSVIEILESNLKEIVSPFVNKISSRKFKLTPAEIQIANLVKQGKRSKEIAEALGLSRKTIDAHRDNIRNKLGIRKKKINLRTHLLLFD